LFNPNKILGDLMSKFSDTFDGDTTVIPLPSDAPAEIPRLTLLSSDNKIKMEIAVNRLNLFSYRKEDGANIDEDSFFDLCFRVLKEYIGCTTAKVGRLALVIVKFLEDSDPGLTLARHFCKDELVVEPFNRPEDFEIHSRKKYKLEDVNINSWVRCKSAILMKDNVPIILVEQDINTLAEELKNNEFDMDQICSFVATAAKEQKSILDKYFRTE
jgi:hypothetical protein